jgi:hypothetical protein
LYRAAVDLNGAGYSSLGVATWANTAAVFAIDVAATNMAIGTTVSLYGIRSVNQ